ncbi:hypothetical protein F4679DRAFT_540135 [Xylaria curta]|nr:hypothetical protein F4679DRAFT_540135 [Xylaria curta]
MLHVCILVPSYQWWILGTAVAGLPLTPLNPADPHQDSERRYNATGSPSKSSDLYHLILYCSHGRRDILCN